MDEALERRNGRGQERRSWTRLGFGGLVDRADGDLRKTGRTEEGIKYCCEQCTLILVAIYFLNI